MNDIHDISPYHLSYISSDMALQKVEFIHESDSEDNLRHPDNSSHTEGDFNTVYRKLQIPVRS